MAADAISTTTLSGELRQSLQVILSAHEVLARSASTSDQQALLELIKEAVTRMAATLDRLTEDAVAGTEATRVTRKASGAPQPA